MKKILVISEIFSSLQGEGKYTGIPTTFIRLYNCNLDCIYCDTKYASQQGKRKNASIENVINAVSKLGNNHICITGGEPLIQDEVYPLIYELVDKHYIVTIETNGSIVIDEDSYNRSFSYCMDIKCPSSGMASYNHYHNLTNLQAKDEVKFVISDYADYLFARGIIKQYYTRANLIFSPCFDENGEGNMKELAEWIEQDKIPSVRLGLQIHKLIGLK